MGSGRSRAAMLALFVLAALPVLPPHAAGSRSTYLAEAEGDSALIGPDRAAEIARQATGGRVLGVDRRGNGRPWYRVKVLIDGERVRYVAVDARDGHIRD